MALLPGWDRERLRTAPPLDVAAARLQVYVREVKPILTRDFAAEIDDLKERGPKEQEAHERKRRAQSRDAMKEAWKLQEAIRAELGLDDV